MNFKTAVFTGFLCLLFMGCKQEELEELGVKPEWIPFPGIVKNFEIVGSPLTWHMIDQGSPWIVSRAAASPYVIEIVNGGHTGLKSLSIKGNSAGTSDSVGVYREDFPENFLGKKIRVSGWCKAKTADGFVQIGCYAGSKNKEAVKLAKFEINKALGVWRKIFVDISLPIDAYSLYWGVGVHGAADLILDDFNVEILDSSISDTLTRVTSLPLENLGFESLETVKPKDFAHLDTLTKHINPWIFLETARRPKLDTTLPHSGKYSLAIGGSDSDYTYLWYRFEPVLFNSKRVSFVIHCRADSFAGVVSLSVSSNTKDTFTYEKKYLWPLVGTKNWSQYRIDLDVPEVSEQVFFTVVRVGKGDVWIDDLQATPIRNLPHSATYRDQSDLMAKPSNLGFEREQ